MEDKMAIRLLNPDTREDEMRDIEIQVGIGGETMAKLAFDTACRMGEKAIRERVSFKRKLAYRLGTIKDILDDDCDVDRLRELIEADRAGRCVVLPPDEFGWTIRGDIMRQIIKANCRAYAKESESQGEKDEKGEHI